MKISSVSTSDQETTPSVSGLKLGIVRLGRVAGKVSKDNRFNYCSD